MDLLKSLNAGALIGLFLLIPFANLSAEDISQETPSVCVSCHGGLKGKLGKPVLLWRKSIHHQMGNSCEGCHGGDPTNVLEAMSPDRGFIGVPQHEQITDVCGHCHIGVKENYMKSPHYKTALMGFGPTCIICHNSHDVKKASLELIREELCGQCHPFENAQKIKKAFGHAEKTLNERKDELRYLGRRGMPVKRLEQTLFNLRNALHQITHSLNVEDVKKTTEAVLSGLNKMNNPLKILRKRIHKRWWLGGIVAVFLIALIIVLTKLLKTYEDES